jgi:hypothetical protein
MPKLSGGILALDAVLPPMVPEVFTEWSEETEGAQPLVFQRSRSHGKMAMRLCPCGFLGSTANPCPEVNRVLWL